ncbi:putative blue pigment (indigoidine) exporter [Nocardioides luteus]|uniref:DMT family transporter n=1 Tax=Nocardioides luteus TaxID=1844 RepID=UPI0016633859|nr:DMT family transporter [Nocardioides luteus]MDR7313282.1 putative blue pigment (indigoidine) exporter [Nocardioides luteus]
MESRLATLLLTAIAPVAWGSGYFVTATFLPPDRPLFGAVVRALPFGLLLLALRPGLLRGSWWWRTAALGLLNFAAFFTLVFVAAYRLPGGLAATLTAVSPIVVMLLAWAFAGERPRAGSLVAGVVGAVGVALLVLRGGASLDLVGVLAAFAAVAVFSTGFILVKVWQPPVGLLTFTAWQLVLGGLVLAPIALVVEGPPPTLDLPAVGGYAYIGLIGTVVAYAVWFRGAQRLPAAAVSLVGLLNPVAGILIGLVFAGEHLTMVSGLGMALVLGGVLLGQPAVIDRIRARHTPNAGVCADVGAAG